MIISNWQLTRITQLCTLYLNLELRNKTGQRQDTSTQCYNVHYHSVIFICVSTISSAISYLSKKLAIRNKILTLNI